MKVVIAYVPVLHSGYLEFFRRHSDADKVLIFSEEVIRNFDWLHRKEIRAIDPKTMLHLIEATQLFPSAGLLDASTAQLLRQEGACMVFADEEESREVAEHFFAGCEVSFDEVFLRWDRSSLKKEEEVSAYPVSSGEVSRILMDEAEDASVHSSDWWRRVGGVLVVEDKKFVAYNTHVPSEHTPWALGDPRNLLKRGVGVEMTSALHVEAGLIAHAAAEGISTKGAKLYVTTFPCPFCANVLAYSGISELYFRDGYSVLHRAELLESRGIKIFRVV